MRKLQKDNNINLSKRIFFYLFGISLLAVIVLGSFWTKNKFKDYCEQEDLIKSTFLESKKLEIKNKILQIKNYIQWVQYFPLNPITQTLSSQLNQLKFQATNSGELKGNYSGSLLQEVKDSLRNLSVPVYLVNNRGEIVYFCNPFSKTGNHIAVNEITAVLSQIKNSSQVSEKAFSIYKTDGTKDSSLSWIGYYNCQIIPGFKVVSAVNAKNFDLVLQDFILDSLRKLRFTENEYIFINSYSGYALVTNGKRNKSPIDINSSGNFAWTAIFKVQQSSANEPDGVFHTYNWPKLSDSSIVLKTSYFSYIPSWKWIIGTGFYEDDVNSIIKLKRHELHVEMQIALFRILFYLLLSTLLCYLLVWYFSRGLSRNIELFKLFFEKAAKENQLIDQSQISYKEFHVMAEAANLMVAERKNVEGKIVKLNRVYAVLSNVNQAIVHVREKQALLDKICQIVISDGQFIMTWIGIVNNKTSKVDVVSSYGKIDDYLKQENIDLSDNIFSQGLTGKAIKAGKLYFCNSIEKDEKMISRRGEALKQGYKSAIALPLLVSGKIEGAFTLYSCEENYFDHDEVELLDKLAMDISYALEFFEIESEHKQAEKETDKLTQQLLKAEEIAHFGFLDWNLITNDIFLSPEINRIYDIPNDVLNVAEFITKVVHPEDIVNVNENLGLAIQGLKKYNIDHRIIRPDGKVVWLNAQAELFKDENGKPVRLLGTILDITDRKLAEEEIKRLNQDLENRVNQRTTQLATSNKELESFSYSISHDLRAPLRAIYGFSQILSSRHRDSLNEEGKQYMDYILEASIRMEQLINDLLNYSRLGRSTLTLHSVSLKKIIDAIEADFKEQLKVVGGKFIIPNELPQVLGDESLLRQIFTNLVGNAVKYRRPDVPLFIKLDYEISAEDHIIKITDNGIGIPREYWEKIFNVFQRLHGEDKYPGTGIGLANVKKAVSLLGGTVYVQSEVDVGSTFFIKLMQNKI